MKKMIYLFLIFTFVLTTENLLAQNFKITGAGTAGVNGFYVENGTFGSASLPKYEHVEGTYFIYHDVYAGGGTQTFWNIDDDLDDETNNVYYFWLIPNPPQTTMPVGSSWSSSGTLGAGTATSEQLLTTPNISFANGAGFSPSSGTPSTTNNPIGRFQLTGSDEGGVLQSVVVSLTGTRTNVTNVKLWSSSDAIFNSGSDKLLSTKSDGSSVTFDSFNSLIDNSGGTYYFVTMDLGAATGSATATLTSQSSFSFVGANSPAVFSNADLSGGAIPLPVELNTFSAALASNSIELNWSTTTEVNNYGFELERKRENTEWNKLGFVNGNGNSNSTKFYFFVDNSELSSGNYFYRLKQIDIDGSFEYSQFVEVTINNPEEFELTQNYPNPFNPTTVINYSLPETSNVKLNVFDNLGRSIVTLINKQQVAGNYKVSFDAGKYNLAGGIYFYKITAGNNSSIKKLLLLK